jgi:hypothetical protein
MTWQAMQRLDAPVPRAHHERREQDCKWGFPVTHHAEFPDVDEHAA